jgi:hypothetical protein
VKRDPDKIGGRPRYRHPVEVDAFDLVLEEKARRAAERRRLELSPIAEKIRASLRERGMR